MHGMRLVFPVYGYSITQVYISLKKTLTRKTFKRLRSNEFLTICDIPFGLFTNEIFDEVSPYYALYSIHQHTQFLVLIDSVVA